MTPTSILITAMAATAAAETIHSVVVFSRHGDRTSKYFPGYTMTNLGANEVYSSGQFYRQRYLDNTSSTYIAGISTDRVVPSQIWASAPDQSVLYQTATNFLQGLYPPLGSLNPQLAAERLTNGTSVSDPLDGYQFILVHGESDTDPDTIWIKGDDQCPAWSSASKTYRSTPSYQSLLNSTASFYAQFSDLLTPILGAGNVSYAHAYDVFDLLNTASVQNASVASRIDRPALDQARYLANEWEWNMNFNASQPGRSIGGQTLAGAFLRQMDAAVQAKGAKQKFNLMAGSYDAFLAFFGVTGAVATSPDFQGLPNYAATMAVEMFSEADGATFPANSDSDLRVRWLFRNGTEDGAEIRSYPLFGFGQESLPYGRFKQEMGKRAITSLPQWCSTCGSTADFCVAANATSEAGRVQSAGPMKGGLSNAAAGGIGAGVTLAVVAVLGGLVMLLMKRRKHSTSKSAVARSEGPHLEKRTSESGSESV